MLHTLLGLLAACGLAGAPDGARYVAGSPAVEQNVRFVRAAPVDGDARAETLLGKPCLRTDGESNNGYIYFAVNRRWLRTHGEDPYRVAVTVEYLDRGTDALCIQYDGVGATVADNFREVAWNRTGTDVWRSRTVVLERAEFRKSQHGQADFRIAQGAGGNAFIASVTLQVLSASRRAARRGVVAAPRFPSRDEVSVPLSRVVLMAASRLGEAERMAADRLAERLRAVGAPVRDCVPLVHPARGRPGLTTLVVGRWRSGMASRYPRTAGLVSRLASDREAFRRRDGYVVCVERVGSAPVVCAVGLEPQGSVYAMGELHVRALRDLRRPTLRLTRAPQLEAPALDRRELYINIGYGLGRPHITVETWSMAEWRRYIDALVLARYNTWSFYLWADSELIHPSARTNRELNLRLHSRLRDVIDYSHQRGMKVGMHFSPSMVPVEIWNAHPELRARLEYPYPGTVCPSQPEAMRLMREVHGQELRWFSTVDFASIWFYDIGGCFCEMCRVPERQLRSLLEQVKTFADIAHAANPRAGFQVMTWAIWRYEQKHHYSIRRRFVEQAQEWFAARRRPFGMADGIYVDPGCTPLFDLMRRQRIPAKVFLYQTNIETGQPFPVLLTRYLGKWLPEAVRAGATSAFLMRMEAGTKVADDAVAGRYLWNPNSAADDAILACARETTGDVRAARLAWEALRRMDDFAWFGYAAGAATGKKGQRIAELALAASASAAPALVAGLDWLRTSGQAYRILGAASEARSAEDESATSALDGEFAALMRQSPLFSNQADGAPYWRDLFRQSLVRFFYSGWSGYHF